LATETVPTYPLNFPPLRVSFYSGITSSANNFFDQLQICTRLHPMTPFDLPWGANHCLQVDGHYYTSLRSSLPPNLFSCTEMPLSPSPTQLRRPPCQQIVTLPWPFRISIRSPVDRQVSEFLSITSSISFRYIHPSSRPSLYIIQLDVPCSVCQFPKVSDPPPHLIFHWLDHPSLNNHISSIGPIVANADRSVC